MRCPHCGHNATVRSSEELTPLVRSARYRCENELCGFVFLAHISVIRTLVESRTPDPGISLPRANPNLNRYRRPDNDDVPVADNDAVPPAADAGDPPMSG